MLRTIIKEYHLLCAAARRKRPERCPETSGDNRKLGKDHILDYLKRTTEHPGKIVYLIESGVRYLEPKQNNTTNNALALVFHVFNEYLT